jgi:hydrogenase-4 component F
MSTLVVLIPLLPVAVAGLVALAGWCRASAWAGPMGAVAVIAIGATTAVHVLDHGAVTAAGGLLRVDALSAYMVIVVGVVTLLATSYGVAYVDRELAHGHTTAAGARAYGVLVQLFVAAMLAALVASNLGVLWVAVEATTIATAFLVGYRRTRASLEASWKYMVICSVGVAFAFLGTVLVYFASCHAGGDGNAALNWPSLVQVAPHLDPGVMRLAIGLLVLGFGTKAGLAPMHTWLPDAYSQAPAPVSALSSGVLLSVAFYALLRYKVIADAALGRGYMRGLLVTAALLSLATAASLMIAQRDYKRLLAYSSVEHMGLVALGAAVGTPLALTACLLHVLSHGLAKSVAFCGSGEILFVEGTTEIAGVRGLVAGRPLVGATFGLGLVALLGLPPFGLFASELGIARAGVADGLGWAVAAALVLVLVIFTAVVHHGQRMLLGDPPADIEHRRTGVSAGVPLVGGLALAVVLGVSIWPIERLLRAAAAVVSP